MSAPFHPPSSGLQPRRILVRSVNWLGDAVMTTPALLRLREAHPGTHITLLTHEKLADLWTNHQAVNAVLAFGAKETVWQVSRRLSAEKFDLALLLPNSTRSAFEAALARIPQRVGYGGSGRGWLLTKAVPHRAGAVAMRKPSLAEIQRLISFPASAGSASGTAGPRPQNHHIHHYLHLAAALGASAEPLAPQLCVTVEEVRAARAKFGLSDGTKWFGVNAGAEYGPAKRWPVDRFLFLAREAAAWPGWGVVLFGGRGDLGLTKEMEEQFWSVAERWRVRPRFVNVSGQTSLRELCALLKCCRVLLTNDTGPMHVAAALGTRVVVPFGSTSPELTGPGLPGDARHQLLKSDAPCSPCYLRECPIDFRCMDGISVERVLEAVQKGILKDEL